MPNYIKTGKYVDLFKVIDHEGKEHKASPLQYQVVASIVNGNNQLIVTDRQCGLTTAVIMAAEILSNTEGRSVGIVTDNTGLVSNIQETVGKLECKGDITITDDVDTIGMCDVILFDGFLYSSDVDKWLRYVTEGSPGTKVVATSSVDNAQSLRKIPVGKCRVVSFVGDSYVK